MTLVVEDGTAKTDSNSYLSVAAADAYLASVGKTAWASLETAEKEAALIQGTRALDAYYGRMFIGERSDDEQALRWPRSNAVDDEGIELDANLVPSDVVAGAALMALMASTQDLFADDLSPSSVEESTLRVGPITISEKIRGGSNENPFREIDLVMTRVLASGGTSFERS
jgi:hypothetical protein